nr:sugar-binding domain-containing protein [Microlunatus antarcticus]
MLEQARAEGIVQITVVHPTTRRRELEATLTERYGLADCIVVPTQDREQDTVTHVVRAAAGYLRARGPRLRTLGVSWGNTLQEIAAMLPSGWAHGLEIIQVNGGISRSVRPTTAADVAMSIARSGHGRASLLPVPAIVEHASTREALYTEHFVQETLTKARAADALLFSLGALSPSSVLVRSGAVTPDELERLRAAGACGDVLGHYLSPDGTIADPDLESRTIGLSLDDLRAATQAIAVASGPAKAPVIRAALTSRLCSVLVTDEAAARSALEP